MDIQLFSIGLLLIVVSWIVQIAYMLAGNKKMTWSFPLFQAIGIGFLVFDMVSNSTQRDLNFYLQIGSGVGALVAFIVSVAKK